MMGAFLQPSTIHEMAVDLLAIKHVSSLESSHFTGETSKSVPFEKS